MNSFTIILGTLAVLGVRQLVTAVAKWIAERFMFGTGSTLFPVHLRPVRPKALVMLADGRTAHVIALYRDRDAGYAAVVQVESEDEYERYPFWVPVERLIVMDRWLRREAACGQIARSSPRGRLCE